MKRTSLVAMAAVLVLASCGRGSSDGDAVTTTKPPSPVVSSESFDLGFRAWTPVSAFDDIWVSGFDPALGKDPGNSVWRIDPKTGKKMDTIPVPGGEQDLAATSDAIWMDGVGTASRIDPKTGKVTDQAELSADADQITAIDDAVYAIGRADDGSLWVNRVNPKTREVDIGAAVATDSTGGTDRRTVIDFVGGEGYLWVVASPNKKGITTVTRLDPETLETVGTTALNGAVSGIVPAKGGAWVVLGPVAEATDGPQRANVLIRIDAKTGKAGKAVTLPVSPQYLSGSIYGMWALGTYPQGSTAALHLDPATGAVVDQRSVADASLAGGAPFAVASDSLWFASEATEGTVVKIGPIT